MGVLIQILLKLFYIWCLLGFVGQVSELARKYFQYTTESSLVIRSPLKVKPPSFSFCPRYVDVFDYHAFNIGRNYSFRPDMLSLRQINQFQTMVTVGDIFKFTPSIEYVLASCFMRKPDSYAYDRAYGAECGRYFKVTKYYLQEFICYSFQLKSRVEFIVRKTAFALNLVNTFYIIELNLTSFDNTGFFKAIAHTDGRPVDSHRFGPVLTRRYDWTNDSDKINWFRIDSYSVSQHKLPPPFDNMCRVYKKTSRHVSASFCLRDCVIDAVRQKLDRIPFMDIVTNESNFDYKPISNDDLTNLTFDRSLNEIDEICRSHCSQPDCEHYHTVTQAYGLPYPVFFRFSIDASREPSFDLFYYATFEFNDFMVMLFSCASTWFGLSIMSFNPKAIRQLVMRLWSSKTNGHSRQTSNTNQTKNNWFLKNDDLANRAIRSIANDVLILNYKIEQMRKMMSQQSKRTTHYPFVY